MQDLEDANWERRLLDECQQAERRGQPFVLIVFALDRGTGRLANETLDLIGDSLRSDVRQTDAVARVGPARYAVLLFDANPASATGVGERLLSHLRTDAGSLVRALTELPVPFGVGVFAPGGRVEDLIAEVERDLRLRGDQNATPGVA